MPIAQGISIFEKYSYNLDTLAKSVKIDRKNQKLSFDTERVMHPEEEA